MYDLASHAQQMDPQQRQVMTAQLLRQRAQAAALQEASQRANQYGSMAAVTQMANNPELAAAAQMLHQNTQRRHAPVPMGQQGFAIPSTGEFVSSPMYEEEKDAARAATRDNARSRFEASLAAQREREQSRADLEAQRAADRAERDRERAIDRGENEAANRVQRAELEAQRASDRAESRQLRLTLAAMAGANKDKKPEKEPLTAKQQQAVLDNRANMGTIDAAYARVEAMPDAFGLKNILPDELMQRLPGKGYSDGVAARAAVQNIGSLKIHDRSGAAVTAAEFPRLKQFVPLTTDTPEVVKEKLSPIPRGVRSRARGNRAGLPHVALFERSEEGHRYNRTRLTQRRPPRYRSTAGYSSEDCPRRSPRAFNCPRGLLTSVLRNRWLAISYKRLTAAGTS